MKYLPRTTTCTLFEIKAPIWNGGKRVVGLAEHRLTEHNQIVFTYVRKSDGQKSFPDTYYFNGDTRGLSRMTVKGLVLVLVPFDKLDFLSREEPPIKEITDPKEMPPLIADIFFNDDKDDTWKQQSLKL